MKAYSYITIACITDGSDGKDGSNGKDGTSVSVSSTSVTYQASSSGTVVPTGSWNASIPSVSKGQYLWTKTVVNYNPSGSTTSYSVSYMGTNGTNGTDGKDGSNGKDGTSVSVSSTSVTYQASTSGTTVPTGTWNTSIPSVSKGQYLWTKTVVSYNPSGSTTTYSVSYMGTNGTDGKDGADGKDGTSVSISSTSVTYQTSSSGTTVPTGNWSNTVPSVTKGQYLWTKTVVSYNPSGSTTSYSVSYMGKDGSNGSDGKDGTNYWMTDQWIDVSDTSVYSEDKWYPVVGTAIPATGSARTKITVQLNSGKKPSWSTHSSGFSVDLDVQDQRSGWGTTDSECLIFLDTYKFCTVSPASYGQMSYGSLPVVYLRGGGKYRVMTDYPVEWSVKANTYTWVSGSYSQSVSPQTSRPVPKGTSIQGADAMEFLLTASSNTYFRDMRLNGNQSSITIYTQVSGYTGTPSISVSNGTLDNGNLEIPYANTYDQVSITATLTGAPTQKLVLSVVDVTEYGKYWGPKSSAPSSGVIDGDSYFSLSDKRLYYRKTNAWVLLSSAGLSDAEVSEICAKAQKDPLSAIPAGSLVGSDFAYFNTVIAGTITADYISSKDIKSLNFQLGKAGYRLRSSDGRLDAVDASISGDISSEAMSASYAEGFSLSVTFTERSVKYNGVQRTVRAIPGDSFSGLKVCGIYVFTGGTLTYDGSGVYGVTTVTGSEDSPIYLVKKPCSLDGKAPDDADATSVMVFALVNNLYSNVLNLYPDDSFTYIHAQGSSTSGGFESIKTMSLSSPKNALIATNILPFDENCSSGNFSYGGKTYTYVKSDIGSPKMMFRNLYAYSSIMAFLEATQVTANTLVGTQVTIKRATAASNAYGSANPRITFSNSDQSQLLQLVYTDYDSVQAPSSLTLTGNQGNEWFIAPNIRGNAVWGAVAN